MCGGGSEVYLAHKYILYLTLLREFFYYTPEREPPRNPISGKDGASEFDVRIAVSHDDIFRKERPERKMGFHVTAITALGHSSP